MRLVLADDHAVMRQGLKAQLERQGTVEIVGEAGNGAEAVALAKALRPDAIILDIAMPRMNGIEAIRQINVMDPGIKLIVLSMHAEHGIVTDALKAGCHAYVVKSAVFEEITAALDAVTQGGRYLSPEITELVVDEFLRPVADGTAAGLKDLSPRERQVLQLTAERQSVKEIARHMHLSPKTIDATRRSVMRKTGEDSIAGLTKLAIRTKLTSVEF